MNAKKAFATIVVVAVVAGAAYYTRDTLMPALSKLPGMQSFAVTSEPAKGGAKGGPGAFGKGGGRPAVSVQVANAEKKPVPVEFDAIGTVAPFAAVAIKSRIDSTITEVNFVDGARVNENDVLFTLDARQIDAQIAQAEGTLTRDKAQLAGFERDVARYSDLIAKGATTQLNLENAKTQAEILKGTIMASTAALDNLKVQRTYTVIRAPISGRISAATVKVGNVVRLADPASIATINQVAPVYVNFPVPQRLLPSLREATAAGTASVKASMPSDDSIFEIGKVAMIENTVDPTTGMVTIRASMDNVKETLWPGTLVRISLRVKTEQAVVIPSVAVQRSQSGNFVFVAKEGRAVVQPVTVGRTYQGQSVVETGLTGGETVVTDGQLSLQNNTPIQAATRRAGA